jgi:hypothetical protein
MVVRKRSFDFTEGRLSVLDEEGYSLVEFPEEK